MSTRVCLVCVWVLSAVCGLPSLPAEAQVPALIRYQGQAVDEKGVPLEGPYTLTFRLYDAETGGTKVWEEVQPAVPLRGGHFSVLLGSVTSLDRMNWDKPSWLAVQVNTEHELEPRQQLTSVPMALTAERLADSASMSPINLFRDGSFESWYPSVNVQDNPTLREWRVESTVSAWDIVEPNTTVVRFGQASAALVFDGSGHAGDVIQRIDDFGPLRERPVTLSVWAYALPPSDLHLDLHLDLEINDGVRETHSRTPLHPDTWTLLTITHVVSPQATRLQFLIARGTEPEASANPGVIYIDGAMAVAGPIPFAFSPHPQDGLGAITTNGINVGIGAPNPTNILTIPTGSSTDPIADSWLIHPSDRAHKDVLRPATGGTYLPRLTAVPVYEWRRKPLVSEEEVRHAVGTLDPTEAELDATRQALLAAKAKLPKFTATRVGMVIDDPATPPEILAYNADGTIAGIDLLAYVGYLHVALKEAAQRLEALERQRTPTPTPTPASSPSPWEQ